MLAVVLAGCTSPARVSPRQAAYNELRKNMAKTEVASILRANRRVRVIQMGDASDPSGDLEYWHYGSDPENDYVVFSFDGKLVQWEYHDSLQATKHP